MGFISLHNHTYASNIRFIDSINKPEDMVKRAIELGYNGIAFTDHESLSAHIAILKVYDTIKEKYPEFKIIHGNEIYLIDESDIGNTKNFYHFILLAKDLEGWHQLCQLSSRAWDRGYFERGVMRVPTTYQDLEEVIGNNPGHILASSACLGSEIDKKILDHDVEGANQFVKWCIKVFGKENFALELQPADSDEQCKVNPILVKFAKHYNIPFIVTTDSHYLNKEDFGIFSSFLNSKQSGDRETDKFYSFTYLMTIDEIKNILSLSISSDDIEDAINNTIKFTQNIENIDFRHNTIVPSIIIPNFKFNYSLLIDKDKYPLITKFYNSEDDQDRYLIYQIEQGIKSKGVEIDAVKLNRINTELDVLDFISNRLNQKLSAYLNLTTDIVNIAWNVSLVGCGRGSACGFYINYLIGITQVNPLTYDLQYWRFLNKERVELPDVDEDFQPEKTLDIVSLLRKEYGDDNVLNCATFKTESLKSAIINCGRGLGYNNDDMQALAALVPAKRGITYSLKNCLEGDDERGLEPVPHFKDQVDKYPGLFDAISKIEGLPTNASIHASALYIFNNGYLAQNSMMRAPNKTKMTAFNMHDSDDMGALKMDVLRTDAQSKMAKCLELLLKDNQIEWQGSLRATYDKYLHPDVLNYDNPIMWEKASSGEIANLFQFETPVGGTCIRKAQPTDVMQLAEINSIMRLQVEGNEQPIDRYVRFRNNPDAWDLEMLEEGLNLNEMDILRKYLNKSHGVSGSQETLMLLVMDPNIANFTLGEANGFRKAVAKKKPKEIQINKEKYFNYGAKLGTRPEFLNYVWKYCVEPQLGYSFSINHTLPYSVIAVQEMNLATRFNPLYWQCACLCVNSGNYVGEYEEDEEANETDVNLDSENAEEVVTNTKKTAPNYGKIAKSIADAQLQGVNIGLPDINESQADFVPDVASNSILYSLRAITTVSDELMNLIIENRPYTSWKDFFDRIHPTNGQMIGLIKAGCFDKLMRQNREEIMNDFLQYVASINCPIKDKLTAVQLKKAVNLDIDLSKFNTEVRIFKFKRFLDQFQSDTEKKNYILSDLHGLKFFNMFIKDKLNADKEEYYLHEDHKAIVVKKTAFEKVFKNEIEPLMSYFNSPDGRQAFANAERREFINELKDKYCSGNISAWEMQTMSFYYSGHELQKVDNAKYKIANFDELPEISTSEDKKELVTLAGTITNVDNAKKTISILTTTGVVNVKFYASAYTMYGQKISEVDPVTKQKTVIDDSWWKRGNIIIVYGERRENTFTAKKNYKDHGNMVGLIESVRPDGSLDIRYKRYDRD